MLNTECEMTESELNGGWGSGIGANRNLVSTESASADEVWAQMAHDRLTCTRVWLPDRASVRSDLNNMRRPNAPGQKQNHAV